MGKVLLPGKTHGQRSLVGYSPWGRKEPDTTERLHLQALRLAGKERLRGRHPSCACTACCAVLSLVAHVSDCLWPPGLQPARLLCPWGFSRQECLSGLPCPAPEDLPNPGIEPRSPALQVDSLPSEPPRKPKNTGVGSLSLLQGIFLTQEFNQRLLHCRRILYQLSYQESPWGPHQFSSVQSLSRV